MLYVITGCSDGTGSKAKGKPEDDHVWKGQTQALDRARDVESVLMESAKKRQEEMDQQLK